nr:hypothetical protein [Calothrix sp. MO_167.B12]
LFLLTYGLSIPQWPHPIGSRNLKVPTDLSPCLKPGACVSFFGQQLTVLVKIIDFLEFPEKVAILPNQQL